MNLRGGYQNNNRIKRDRNSASSSSSANNNSANGTNPNAASQSGYYNFTGLTLKDHTDLDTFKVALMELTFNSRPVIEKLTEMARERAKTIAGPISRTILDNLVFVSKF